MSQVSMFLAHLFSCRKTSMAVLVALPLCVVWSFAQADDCSVIARQIRSADRTVSGADALPLMRQLSAIRRLEQQRRCSSDSMSGLFNACRDLANRKAGIQSQLSRLGSGSTGRLELLRARYSSLRCSTSRKVAVKENTSRPAQSTTQPSRGSKKEMFFCVRQEDGYYFPASNSQFVGTDYASNMLDRCKYICGTQNIDLYVLDDPAKETEEMVSVSKGLPYKDLHSAFRYRDAAKFAACDFRDYHRRVALVRANAATTLATYKNVNMPVPGPRPEIAYAGEVTPAATVGMAQEDDMSSRKIRIILPGMMPPDSEQVSVPAPEVDPLRTASRSLAAKEKTGAEIDDSVEN
ncbi:DUF2865 domain-containing protein [Mesorhizobium sp. NPDC059054]|uniref:DUF2865 domain-containing protein n=1 Tax=Mesorhizobium sp. NPDC059054 TaxID=3346711 RepID=UPI003683CCFE